MIRAFLFFLVYSALFGALITLFRKMTGKEKLELIKLIGFSIICSTLSILTLTAIVILF